MLVGLARLALLFIVPAISTNTISASSNQELLDAVQAGHLGTVETLLRLDGSSVDVNAVIDDVWALYLAARAGRLEIVEILLVNGADTNVATHSGHTALGAAAFGGHLSVAAKLLTAGAYINSITEQGETPLHAVARAGHNEKGDLSETCAVFKVGDPETCVTSVLSALVAAGAFVNANGKGGQTPLHLACTAGHSKTVSALLEAGAFVDLQDISGFTPLHIVTGYGFVEAAGKLLAAGANVNQQTWTTGLAWSPLHLAADQGQAEVMKLLLANGADVSLTAKRSETALHLAASKGKDQVLGLLLEAGADVDDVDKNGKDAMSIALQNQGTEYKTNGAVYLLKEWAEKQRKHTRINKRGKKKKKGTSHGV